MKNIKRTYWDIRPTEVVGHPPIVRALLFGENDDGERFILRRVRYEVVEDVEVPREVRPN